MKSIELNQNVFLAFKVSLLIGLTGAAAMVGINFWTDFPLLSKENIAQTLSAFLGACLSGGALFWCFGRSRRRGFLFAILGGIAATSLGAYIGAAFYFGVFEGDRAVDAFGSALVAAVVVPMMVASAPSSAGAWLAGMFGSHLVARKLRQVSSENSGCP